MDIAEVDEINDQYKSDLMSVHDAEVKVKLIMKGLQEKENEEKKVGTERNLEIMQQYFAWKYEKKHRINRLHPTSIDGAFNELKRAVIALGDKDLDRAPIEEIQFQIDEYYGDRIVPHKKTVMRINSMLRFIERPKRDHLEGLPSTFEEVNAITEEEFLEMLAFIPCEDSRRIVSIAFYTGLRLGEIFAVTKSTVRNSKKGLIILVNRQMRRDFSFSLPKRRKSRQAYGFLKVKDELAEWIEKDLTFKKSMRNKRWSKIVADACQKADLSAKLCFHDLRHSYAVSLLNMGVSMSKVAMSLGNDEGVCKRHYVGYSLNDEGIMSIGDVVDSKDE